MKKKIIILSLLLISNTLFSETNTTLISLEDFIKSSLKNYPDIKLNKYDANYAKARLIQVKALNDFNIEAEAYKNISHPVPEGSSAIDKTDADSINVSISRAFSFSGTRLKAGAGLSDVKIDYPSYSAAKFLPEVYFQITQPLLKNWFGLLDRIPIRQAELGVKLNIEKNKESDEALIAELHKLYYNWILYKEELKIYNQNYKNAQILLKQIKKKYNNGVADAVDLNKTKAMAIKYKKITIMYKTQLSSIERNILKYSKGDIILKDTNNISPVYTIDDKSIDYDTKQNPIEDTRKMRILNYTKKIYDKDIIAGKNMSLPELNLMLSANLQSYTPDKKSFDNFKYDEYSIGLALAYPLGNHEATGKTKEAKSNKEKTLYDIKSFQLNYSYNLNYLISMINTYKKTIIEDKELISVTKKQLSAEEKKYRQGRSDLSYVIDARNTLLNLELDYLKDYFELKKLYIQYLDIIDKLYFKYL